MIMNIVRWLQLTANLTTKRNFRNIKLNSSEFARIGENVCAVCLSGGRCLPGLSYTRPFYWKRRNHGSLDRWRWWRKNFSDFRSDHVKTVWQTIGQSRNISRATVCGLHRSRETGSDFEQTNACTRLVSFTSPHHRLAVACWCAHTGNVSDDGSRLCWAHLFSFQWR